MVRNIINTLKERTNTESRDSLLSYFLDEIYGDTKQTIMLCSLMEYIQTASKSINMKNITPLEVGKSVMVDPRKNSLYQLCHMEVQGLFK